ncbi:MAG: hypothetical protein IKI19_00095 [Prevotella sp.]|nr:hypothetical protein [Prevotella sp.]
MEEKDVLSLEHFIEMTQEAEKLAWQMEKAVTPHARCVSLIMACCFIIEMCRRNMHDISLKNLTQMLPSYMLVANRLVDTNENEKSQEDE